MNGVWMLVDLPGTGGLGYRRGERYGEHTDPPLPPEYQALYVRRGWAAREKPADPLPPTFPPERPVRGRPTTPVPALGPLAQSEPVAMLGGALRGAVP